MYRHLDIRVVVSKGGLSDGRHPKGVWAFRLSIQVSWRINIFFSLVPSNVLRSLIKTKDGKKFIMCQEFSPNPRTNKGCIKTRKAVVEVRIQKDPPNLDLIVPI